MADIHPFPAILFRPEGGPDVTSLVTPPYDVIDSEMRNELLARNPHNVARLILPETPAGGDRYQEAGRLFQEWLGSGILQVLETPTLFMWEQEFNLDGTARTRRALVAKVTCEIYRPGAVMRHENTHESPKADRLKLFQATEAQFSQIFGIFQDDGGTAAHLAEAGLQEPLRTARGDDGHISRLFRIEDKATIRDLQARLRGCTITIADGHHRYESSVAYYQQNGRVGSTLMTLVPSNDPGLVVLPTHRTIALPVDTRDFSRALSDEYTIEEYTINDWQRYYQEAVDHTDRQIILAVVPSANQIFRIERAAKNESSSMSGEIAGDLGDIMELHDSILPRLKVTDSRDTATFGYFHSAADAVKSAEVNGRWAFLVRPTSVNSLIRASEYQEVMPPKSTYFFPKYLSGFISARLD